MISYSVCVCLSVRAITFECLDIETSFLVWWYILIISRGRGCLCQRLVPPMVWCPPMGWCTISVGNPECATGRTCSLKKVPFDSRSLVQRIDWRHLICGGSRISSWGVPSRYAVWGVPTSDVGAFWQKRIRKQKNWILLVVGWGPAAPPGSANAYMLKL